MRFNVGSLLHQSVGTSRDFEIDIPSIQVADDLSCSQIRGAIRFTRTSEGLYLHGKLDTAASLVCDRCLVAFDGALVAELEELYVHPARPGVDPSATVPETGMLDIEPLVHECLLLAMPSHPLCKSDCKGLCPECGANRNVESCDHPEAEIDPRLAALKSLLQ